MPLFLKNCFNHFLFLICVKMAGEFRRFIFCCSTVFHFALGLYYISYDGKRCFADVLTSKYWSTEVCSNSSNTHPLQFYNIGYFLFFMSSYMTMANLTGTLRRFDFDLAALLHCAYCFLTFVALMYGHQSVRFLVTWGVMNALTTIFLEIELFASIKKEEVENQPSLSEEKTDEDDADYVPNDESDSSSSVNDEEEEKEESVLEEN